MSDSAAATQPHALAQPLDEGRWVVRVTMDDTERASEVSVQALDSPPLRVESVVRTEGQPLAVTVSLARPLAVGDPERGSYLLRLSPDEGGWAAFGVSLALAPVPAAPAAPPLPAGARIDYRARDYDGYRELMMGYMAAAAPRWVERSPADLGVTLVELMAYAADNLSYMQDAAGTEAYLGTARRRTSLRRHARLLDYVPSEGCSAFAWVQVSVAAPVAIPAGTPVTPDTPGMTGLPPVLLAGTDAWRAALAGGRVFETCAELRAEPALNGVTLYAWGAADFVLAPGTTQATLVDTLLPGGGRALENLAEGQVLVLEEARSPVTGSMADADSARRQPVRLVSVAPTWDPRGAGGPVPVVDVAWAAEDGLDFSLVVAGTAGAVAFTDGARARGNLVLADHGASSGGWVKLGPLAHDGVVALPSGTRPLSRTVAAPVLARPPRRRAPDPDAAFTDPSARAALAPDPAQALPAVEVRDARHRVWAPRHDLLASGPFSREFVVEIEDDESATLRFGDGQLGMRPGRHETLHARWRTGYGPSGNVGPDTLVHVVAPSAQAFEAWAAAVLAVSNPVGAAGGAAAEGDAYIRTRAPQTLHTQARCITAGDWAAAAGAVPGVLRARAKTRWTGSWPTVMVSVQPQGGGQADRALLARVSAALEPLRPAGHDVTVRGPRWVPLQVALVVAVAPDRSRRAVENALADALGDGMRADGTPGYFHPDRFSFGAPVYLSPLLAAAMAVPGVQDVRAHAFRRAGAAGGAQVVDPIPMGDNELPRASTGTTGEAWRGSVTFRLRGGR